MQMINDQTCVTESSTSEICIVDKQKRSGY